MTAVCEQMASQCRRRSRAQRGVTLVELLLALLIFALLSSAGVYALRLAIDGQAQFSLFDDRIAEWQTGRAIIRRDLAQLALRPVRDEFGEAAAGVMVGGETLQFSRRPVVGERPLVGFVRRNWTNPGAVEPRSELQYVEYVLVGAEIVRRIRPYLDDAPNQPRFDRTLFRNVSNAEVDFLIGETTRGLDWVNRWPGPGVDVRTPPRALRITLTTERLGTVEQLFWIGEFDVGAL